MSALPRIPKALLEKYRTSAPRYTSYPTAVDWTGEFDPDSYPALLAAAAERDDALSVYVHLPFCAEMCLFCGCNVTITRNHDRVDAYLDMLERELATVAKSGIGRRAVTQYHWGGGTPTHLDLQQIERVQRAFTGTFHLAQDAEAGIEVDPRVTTNEQIALLASLGFNRVSLGVQDFDATVQRAVKRVQSEADTRRVVDTSRAQGISSVNIDLIYGLPHQTASGFENTVNTVLDIRPERVALFHYAHVPWMKKHQTALDVDALPTPDQKLAIFTRSVEQFTNAGYVYIGLDHFALPDDELALALAEESLGRNFMGYTTRRGADMISLGVSAIGDVEDTFVQNLTNQHEYDERVDQHGFATYRGHTLDDDDRLRRAVIMELMCNGVVHKPAIEARFGIAFDTVFEGELAQLEPLEADGLVLRESAALRLTPLGQVFMRNVALPFDSYYRARQERGESGKQTFSKTL